MDWDELHVAVADLTDRIASQAHRIPGSSIALRYVKSSYQNDPVRSVIELFLFLFAVRYLLASSYSVKKHKGFVNLNEEVGHTGQQDVGRSDTDFEAGSR